MRKDRSEKERWRRKTGYEDDGSEGMKRQRGNERKREYTYLTEKANKA